MSQQLTPAPIGIDIGTYKSKIAVAKRGGVDVITNEANFRQTPCIVGYGKQQRHIGESGNIKMKSNFKDTVVAPMRFLGLEADYPLLRSQTRFSPAPSNRSDDKLKFDVNYQGTKHSLLPEQVMAAYFNKMKLTMLKNGLENKEAIISVPTYLTQKERQAYLDAARIAELNVVRLINDSTAIALDYGLFRKNDLDAETARNVLFIDFGHSKLGVFACSFTKSEMNVLEQQYCRNLGCRDIDYQLYEFYRGVFEKSSGGLDLSESKKAYVKLMEQIERQRKILSGNLQHDMNIEYLMEDNDLAYTMKRQKFVELANPVFIEIKRVLVKVREQLKAKDIKLHSIELIGGGSRIPSFLEAVKQVYNMEPSRTLNSSESVARGCALEAAIKSPLFRVQDYILNQRVYNGVKFYWNFVENNHYLGLDSTKYPPTQGKMIYDFGAKVPSSKTIKFKRKEPIQILIEYEPNVVGFSKHIGYYRTPAQHPKHQNFGVSFKIKYNENGMITFQDCNLIQEWVEQTKISKKKDAKKEEKKDEKKPHHKDKHHKGKEAKQTKQGQDKKAEQMKGQQADKAEPMEAQEQVEIKKTKKEHYHPIKFEANEFRSIAQKQLHLFFTLQSEMLNKDKLILQTYEKKNELESICYKWKQNLTKQYAQYAKAEDIPAIIKMLEENSHWLYEQGAHASRGAYNERLQKVYAKIHPIMKRYEAYNNITEQIPMFRNNLLAKFKELNTMDKKYEHITSEERQQAFNAIESAKVWISNIEDQHVKTAKSVDPHTSLATIRNKTKDVNEQVRKTLSKPVPKPAEPKKEEKKDDKAEQKMDVETGESPAGDAGDSAKPSGEKMDTE